MTLASDRSRILISASRAGLGRHVVTLCPGCWQRAHTWKNSYAFGCSTLCVVRASTSHIEIPADVVLGCDCRCTRMVQSSLSACRACPVQPHQILQVHLGLMFEEAIAPILHGRPTLKVGIGPLRFVVSASPMALKLQLRPHFCYGCYWHTGHPQS